MLGFVVETMACTEATRATSAISGDTFLPFDLPGVSRKKVSANFDGGAISSDGGLLLLREADRHLGLTGMLASCVQDRRDPSRISDVTARMTAMMADVFCKSFLRTLRRGSDQSWQDCRGDEGDRAQHSR
jgi:hypothetical protein